MIERKNKSISASKQPLTPVDELLDGGSSVFWSDVQREATTNVSLKLASGDAQRGLYKYDSGLLCKSYRCGKQVRKECYARWIRGASLVTEAN